MKYKVGQTLKIAKDIDCNACVIPAGSTIQITAIDSVFKLYYIEQVDNPKNWICDVSEEDILCVEPSDRDAHSAKKAAGVKEESALEEADDEGTGYVDEGYYGVIKLPGENTKLIISQLLGDLIVTKNFNVDAMQKSLQQHGIIRSRFNEKEAYEDAILRFSCALNIAINECCTINEESDSGIAITTFIDRINNITQGMLLLGEQEAIGWFRGDITDEDIERWFINPKEVDLKEAEYLMNKMNRWCQKKGLSVDYTASASKKEKTELTKEEILSRLDEIAAKEPELAPLVNDCKTYVEAMSLFVDDDDTAKNDGTLSIAELLALLL